MKTFEKSNKLDNVCYDIRGPVMDEANRMIAEGIDILKLNIGNPAVFDFRAPQSIIDKMSNSLTDTEGYSDSKGLLSAREAIVKYCKKKGINNVTVDDVYTGNGVSELSDFAECCLCGTAAVISPVGKIVDHGKEICFPSGMEKMGPISQKLYDTLTGIQKGEIEAPEGWICEII